MTSTVSTAAGAEPATTSTFLGHPTGLYVCFATELWERFSFYGMKYLLLLYLTKYHLFTDKAGYDIFGAYAGLVYGLPVIGGLLADRYLGMRKSVVFGAILLSCGHILMAFEGAQAVSYEAGSVLASDITLNDGSVLLAGTLLQERVVVQDVVALKVFFLALALITVGVGFLKPNISTVVGNLYKPGDPRRDSGFTIFYMGINIGSFTATVLCGWLGETYGWSYGFGAAGIGMIFGLITFLAGQKHLQGLAEPTEPEKLKQKVFGPIDREWLIYLGGLASLGVVWFLVQNEPVVHIGQNVLLLCALVGIPLYALLKGTREDLHRTVVLMVLITSTVVFWALFEQSAGSMTLFADRVVDRSVFGYEVNASQTGALNPMFIILVAPLMAFLWIWLGKRNWEPSTPVKFGLGIIFAGLGFGAMVLGGVLAGEDSKVAFIWLVLGYLLHSVGELCLSPVGLSAVTKLSIRRVVGVSMGTWFLAQSLAETVATRLAKLAAVDTHGGEAPDVATALATYSDLFTYLTWLGVGVGIFMLLISPLLRRGMHGIH